MKAFGGPGFYKLFKTRTIRVCDDVFTAVVSFLKEIISYTGTFEIPLHTNSFCVVKKV